MEDSCHYLVYSLMFLYNGYPLSGILFISMIIMMSDSDNDSDYSSDNDNGNDYDKLVSNIIFNN